MPTVSDLAGAICYAIRHWTGLVVFVDDGRVEMDTNALFAGSDGGARHWAIAMTLIQTAKLNGVDPIGWLTDVLSRILSGETKAPDLHTLLSWKWAPNSALPVPTKTVGGPSSTSNLQAGVNCAATASLTLLFWFIAL